MNGADCALFQHADNVKQDYGRRLQESAIIRNVEADRVFMKY